jgi:hypothetical protein
MKPMPPQAELDQRYVVAPVLKAIRVLHLVCEAPQPLSLNDLAVLAALPKTTVFRYLRSFLAMRMVEHDASTDRYRAGLGPVVAFARRKSLQASSPNLPSDLEAPPAALQRHEMNVLDMERAAMQFKCRRAADQDGL